MEYRFALAGDPVAHSLSPLMHSAALEAAGLTGSYGLEPCDAEGFRDLVEALRVGEYSGLNVTMPHKGLAYSLSEQRTVEARDAASVNTMRAEDRVVVGHSSDVVAFRGILVELDDSGPPVVLGAGGSARAAIAATRGDVFVWARDPGRITELRDRFGERVTPLGSNVEGSVLINCTPLGMKGEHLPPGVVDSAGALVDLPYGSGQTPAVSAARSRGIPVVDGFEFLARQGAVSFTWWTGVPIGVGTMVEAAKKA